jgi:two-component system LytT family sensor kinase
MLMADVSLPRWSFRTVLLAWSVPAVLGVPFAIGSLATAPVGLAPWRVLVVLATTWQVWALMTLPVLALADGLPLDRPLRLRAVAAHAGACLAACAVQAVVTALVFRALMVPATSYGQLITLMLLRFAPAGVLAYAAIVAARMSQVARSRAAAREAEAQQLARRLAEAELMALRAQLRPHFLFNALNATIALVRDAENVRAADTLLSLSALLRAMLRGDARHEVALAEELEFVEQYLAIERLRIGERLQVCVDIPESLRDARVPALCVQPFVENAVLHGLRHVTGDARIAVSAREDGGRLELRVTDNGAGLPPAFDSVAGAGLGIGNTRARLALLYGDRAHVRLGTGRDGRGTTAEITLPLSHGVGVA